MTVHPMVDINLFVHNGAATVEQAIESVLAQSWPALKLTLIDNCSTDGTADILADYARRFDWVGVRRNRVDVGAVLNCQRAFWHGEADFVMPKTADDLIAPDFVERMMAVLLAQPDCAMCHAAGLVFTAADGPTLLYPPGHLLSATDPDPVVRACHVMARYTSAPAFWGVYRRDAVDRLARIPYRAGWDHALLAELALYGEIRHVPEPLFWRRDGGKPVRALARGCSEYSQRGLPLDGLADRRWQTPLITTAFAHVEVFAAARLDAATRHALMQAAPRVFRERWGLLLVQEASSFRAILPRLIAEVAAGEGVAAAWMAQQLSDALRAISIVLPGQDFTSDYLEIAALTGAAALAA